MVVFDIDPISFPGSGWAPFKFFDPIHAMGDSNFFKGTSTDQDRRFADKQSKLLKTLKFSPEFEQKVSTTL
jgi:hypothetical protein